MNKFKEWTKKPITYGWYLKACIISVVIALAEITYIFGGHKVVIEKVQTLKGKFKSWTDKN